VNPGRQAFEAMARALTAKPLLASFAPHWLVRRPVAHVEREQQARGSAWLKRTAA
jgi:tRNA U34 5-methylaminomethyl-2-thiouridine-forming methyltransferase MnmC